MDVMGTSIGGGESASCHVIQEDLGTRRSRWRVAIPSKVVYATTFETVNLWGPPIDGVKAHHRNASRMWAGGGHA
ncbi:MAG: hypothetical protein PVF59_01090, partial [Desulfobacterales bacterium]